ncbi:MAG: TniB family NTP-binding protein [Cyanobacteria bacterium P01_A01_bin.84]
MTEKENEEAIAELIWTLESSQGEFKLILARCNYLRLRSRLVEQLRKLINIDIQVLHLKKSDKTLYAKIYSEVKGKQPPALMIFYLESVQDLEQMFSASNQVREEFRKQFNFPIVLWVTDKVFQQFVHSASDFESWATTTEFIIPTEDLIKSLQEDTDALFAAALVTDAYCISWKMGYLRRREISTALKDLKQREMELDPFLIASVEFVRGQDAYLQHQIETALEHYQNSLIYWQQIANQSRLNSVNAKSLLRQGVVMFYIGLCYQHQAQKYQTPSLGLLNVAKTYLQDSINIFTDTNRSRLVAKFINPLGIILRYLQAWEELSDLAYYSLTLQQQYGNPIRIAQAHGFLAEVALHQNNWLTAKKNVYRALHHLTKIKSPPLHQRSLYLLLLAQAEIHLAEVNLAQIPQAIKHLQMARDAGIQNHPRQYICILKTLRSLYWQQGEYLEAFRTKIQERSIEQQYGWRAFIGSGKIGPHRYHYSTALTQVADIFQEVSFSETVAPEITESGREKDIENLLERIARPDFKLIVIYGHSGVGKSSLIHAGLIPRVKQKAITVREIIPVVVVSYTDWLGELAKLLESTLKSRGIDIPKLHNSSSSILNILHKCSIFNIQILLIFDELEEFLSIESSLSRRYDFFNFLGECINILSVKVIILMREDYLHHLCEFNSLPSMSIINNNIFSNQVLYQLGNLPPKDAKSLINRLTEYCHFHLESTLIDQLIEDLSKGFEQVRPIELQIVGAQIQTVNITTLNEYQKYGGKEKLIHSYIQEIINDCGDQNKQTAKLVLQLLTDETENNPPKTLAELSQKLTSMLLKLDINQSQLDLVLHIFLESGIVALLPNHYKFYSVFNRKIIGNGNGDL